MPAGYYAPTIRLMRKTLESYAVDAGPVFKRCGIDLEALRDPDARISNAAAERLWSSLDGVTGDPAVGLRTAEVLHPSHLGALGYAWLASDRLRTALQRTVRYVRVVTELRQMKLIDNGDELELETLYLLDTNSVATRADASLAMLVKMCRWNLGDAFAPSMVELRRPRPINQAPYHALFRCPVYFGAGRDVLSLSSAHADQHCTGDHPRLAEMHETLVADYLDGLDQNHLLSQVRAQIVSQLPNGEIRIGAAARAMHMSVRTLQRRLTEQDTSFRELLEATRRELAERYLRDRRMSIGEIAFRAGFADMGAFSKTVRQWTGLSPSQYRQRMASHHPAR